MFYLFINSHYLLFNRVKHSNGVNSLTCRTYHSSFILWFDLVIVFVLNYVSQQSTVTYLRFASTIINVFSDHCRGRKNETVFSVRRLRQSVPEPASGWQSKQRKSRRGDDPRHRLLDNHSNLLRHRLHGLEPTLVLRLRHRVQVHVYPAIHF